MYLKVLILSLLTYSFNLHTNANAELENHDLAIEGYYWRDYTGTVPKDALVGGVNANGKVTYIGQVLHQDQLIPAKIDSDKKIVTYEWRYKEYEASINIKILCTQHPEEFEWVDTDNQHIGNITDKNFVLGGYEVGKRAVYIGRKLLGNELVIGKVVHGTRQSTLTTTKDGIGIQHSTFQVLAYTPSHKTTTKTNGNHGTDSLTNNGNNNPECEQNTTIVINFYS